MGGDRDVDTIDRELELLAAVAASIRRLGGTPSIALIDELLDLSRRGSTVRFRIPHQRALPLRV